MVKHEIEEGVVPESRHKVPKVETPVQKMTKAKCMDIESDGKNVFLEIDLTDGQTTLKLEPTFPKDASADDVIAYMKGLVEDNPVLTPELQELIGLSLVWDSTDESWYELRDNTPKKRLKNKGEKGYVEKGRADTK